MKEQKPKILFIMHMPPPVHGAAMMGKYIHDSKVINEKFDCHYSNLTLAKNIEDIGKGGPRKLHDFISQLKNIRKEVKAFKPDLCYVTPNSKGGAFYKDFCVIMMLKLMRQNIVVHYHNKGVLTHQDKPLDNFLYKLFFKNLKVILLANGLYNDVKKYVTKENVFICPNGIPEATQAKDTSKGNDSIPHILFLSNLLIDKGVFTLLDACKLLKEKGVTFICDFIGGESKDINADSFQAEVKKRKLEQNVFYHGKRFGVEKEEFFTKADIFILPTYDECFPLVLLEAMQHHIACIASNEGGISDIIDEGNTGFIVEKKNALQLADRIRHLIGHPELCKEMGEKGYKKYRSQFTLQTFENRMKEILTECCRHEKSPDNMP